MAKGKRAKTKKRKLNNFTKTILLLIAILLTISIAPNYIKQINNNQIICILNDNNINDRLADEIKIDEQENVFMSFDDIKNNLDNTIYQEDNYIIATGNTSVAVLKFNENKVKINGTEIQTLASMYKDENDKIYIPISELKKVYNIEINIINNNILIRNVNNKLIKCDAKKNLKIKYKQTEFSRTIDKVKKGEKIVLVEENDNDWAKVCTKNGILGYVKKDFLVNKVVTREDMNYIDNYNDILDNNSNISEIDINKLELSNYEKREKEVNKVLAKCMKDSINIVKLNYNDSNNLEDINRLYIELLPRLREIGIKLIK